jgi:hypothetical protein
MKQIGMFTSMFPGQSHKTQSEEFREAAEKEKHRKQILAAAAKGDEKKLQLLLTKYSGIDLNAKVRPQFPPPSKSIHFHFFVFDLFFFHF